jgi:hypothetical protein
MSSAILAMADMSICNQNLFLPPAVETIARRGRGSATIVQWHRRCEQEQ